MVSQKLTNSSTLSKNARSGSKAGPGPRFEIVMATGPADIEAAQALRYDVFVRELGGDGPMVDHTRGLECDDFDAFADHMLLFDRAADRLAGVYRMMRTPHAAAAGRFYSAGEYDLTPLLQSGRPVLELGRSCLHPAYRGGTAMYQLWCALARYVAAHQIEVLFGVASFHGADPDALAEPLSLLHHNHLAPENLRVTARAPGAAEMNRMPAEAIDKRAAMVAMPTLIKAYLRLGGVVGQGAFVDHAFNTTDVCLIMDTARLTGRQGRLYGAGIASQ